MNKIFFFLSIAILSTSLCLSPGQTYAEAPKNVILVIGDGMGPSQLSLALLFQRYSKEKRPESHIKPFLDKSELGWMLPTPYNGLVIDSACAITEISSGVEARSESLGLDYSGNQVKTVLEYAREHGKSTGLISDTRITHATPAGFVAKVPQRSNESKIAEQLIESGTEVLLSGGLGQFIPRDLNNKDAPGRLALSALIGSQFNIQSDRTDNRDLLKEAQHAGYQLITSRQQLLQPNSGKILGLFSISGMPDAIRADLEAADPNSTLPTLAEMTRKGIDTLSADPDGFFLMVEAGQIDWASHSNDTGTLLHEMMRLESVLGEIARWVEGRDDTLVILTADHETGAFGLSYSAAGVPSPTTVKNAAGLEVTFAPQYNFGNPRTLDRIYAQKQAFYPLAKEFMALPLWKRRPERLADLIRERTGFQITAEQSQMILSSEKNPYFRPGVAGLSAKTWPKINDFSAFYPDADGRLAALIGRALASEQGVVWGSGSHTASPVIVAAQGPERYTARFRGFYSAVELGKKLISLYTE
ncbi:MAG: alkaline phosphatase [Oligoflexia bacterium]|nr:alkaline phosphatase [Oligoflexia bacterium]